MPHVGHLEPAPDSDGSAPCGSIVIYCLAEPGDHWLPLYTIDINPEELRPLYKEPFVFSVEYAGQRVQSVRQRP
jgi:hypothetical protein